MVQVFGAASAIVVDAISFLVSVASLVLIRRDIPRASQGSRGVRVEIAEGAAYIARQPLLRALLGAALISSFFGNGIGALYFLWGIRELALPPVLVGLAISADGVSSLAGSVFAQAAGKRLGVGPAIGYGRLRYTLLSFLIPLAGGPPCSPSPCSPSPSCWAMPSTRSTPSTS